MILFLHFSVLICLTSDVFLFLLFSVLICLSSYVFLFVHFSVHTFFFLLSFVFSFSLPSLLFLLFLPSGFLRRFDK